MKSLSGSVVVVDRFRRWFSIGSFLIVFLIAILSPNGAQCVVSSAAESSRAWSHSSLLHGVLQQLAEAETDAADDQCRREVGQIVAGIAERQPWALKILDTGPHLPSSFVYGNNFWFSAANLCEYANRPLPITLSRHLPKRQSPQLLADASPVAVGQRMVYANYTTGMQVDSNFPVLPIIHIGLCVPKSCSDKQIVRSAQLFIGRNELPIQGAYGLQLDIVAAKNVAANGGRIVWTPSLVALCFILAFALIVLLGNLIASFTIRSPSNAPSKKSSKTTPSKSDPNEPASTESQPSTLVRIARCFDLRQHLHQLYHHPHPERDVAAMAGLRSLICIWLIVFHVNYHSGFALSNLAQLLVKMESFELQPVFQAFLYVDVFFVLSAILLVYNFLRNDRKRQLIAENTAAQNVLYYLRHLLHRYVRLTPVLLVTMILSDCIYDWLDRHSPFYMNPLNDLYCKETWWHNLLYVQNFIRLTAMCSSWTWYLACDMQFYALGLFGLFVYTSRPIVAKAVYVGLSIGLVILSYHLNCVHQLSYAVDAVMANLDILYTVPWTRAHPFLGGALIGWLLYVRRNCGWPLPLAGRLLYWSLAAVIFATSLFYTCNRQLATVWYALLMSLGKFGFGVYIGSLVLMCEWGNGDGLRRLWAHPVFQHLSKLSYCVYMVSPLVITGLHGAKEVGTHFDEVQTTVNVLATFSVSYAIAVLLSIFYELPFQQLSDEFVMRKSSKSAARSATVDVNGN